MSSSRPLLVFGSLIGFGVSAQAGPIDDCISGNVAHRILICTEVIQDDHLDDQHKAEAYDSRGTGYFAQGKLAEAISDFDQAARLVPDHPSFRVHKGDASLAAGQLDEAIVEYNQAIRLAPGSSDGFIGRGTVRLHQQKLEEALADFDEAVRLDPKLSSPTTIAAMRTLVCANSIWPSKITIMLLIETRTRFKPTTTAAMHILPRERSRRPSMI